MKNQGKVMENKEKVRKPCPRPLKKNKKKPHPNHTPLVLPKADSKGTILGGLGTGHMRRVPGTFGQGKHGKLVGNPRFSLSKTKAKGWGNIWQLHYQSRDLGFPFPKSG